MHCAKVIRKDVSNSFPTISVAQDFPGMVISSFLRPVVILRSGTEKHRGGGLVVTPLSVILSVEDSDCHALERGQRFRAEYFVSFTLTDDFTICIRVRLQLRADTGNRHVFAGQ